MAVRLPPCEDWANRPSNIPPGQDPTTHPAYRHLNFSTQIRRASFARVRDAMRSYRIYPPRLVEGHVCSQDGMIGPGVIILQTARLARVPLRSAVRVQGVQDGAGIYAFTYETLQNHPEQGIIRFSLETTSAETAMFSIQAWSRPGNWLSRLGRPLALAWQRRANRAALRAIQKLGDQ